MKRAKIYLKLFWVNRYLIMTGVWYSFLSLFTKRYKWISERKAICDECAFNSKLKQMPSPDPYRKDAHCVICTCNLFLKQASPCSECAIATITKDSATVKWKSQCEDKS